MMMLPRCQALLRHYFHADSKRGAIDIAADDADYAAAIYDTQGAAFAYAAATHAEVYVCRR